MDNQKQQKKQSPASDNLVILFCERHKGTERRNVPKFIIREYIKFMLNDPKSIYAEISKKVPVDMKEFNQILEMCDELKTNEKVRTPSKVRKDYVKVINGIMKHILYNMTFNLALTNILQRFDQDKYGRISASQKIIYKTTIEELYNASSKLIDDMNKSPQVQEENNSQAETPDIIP